MRKWLFFIPVYFFQFSIVAQELFPLNEPASNVPKGVLGVRVFGETYREIGIYRRMGVLRLMYGVTPKLTVMASVAATNHHGKHLPPDLVTHTHVGSQTIYSTQNIRRGVDYPYSVNGIYLFAKYRFLTFDEQHKHFRMALYGEWSNVNSPHDEAEPNLMDDTKGYGGGLIMTYLKYHLAISLTSGVVIPGKYEETVPVLHAGSLVTHTELYYGRAVKYNLSFGYLLFPKEVKDYEQNNFNIYMEFIGKSYEAARIMQDDVELESKTSALRAGYYVEVRPGIQEIINSNLRIDFSVGFNLINRSYVHPYPIYMVGIQRYFYFKK